MLDVVFYLVLMVAAASSAVRAIIAYKMYVMKKIEFDQKYMVIRARSEKEADEIKKCLAQNGRETVLGEPLDFPNEH